MQSYGKYSYPTFLLTFFCEISSKILQFDSFYGRQREKITKGLMYEDIKKVGTCGCGNDGSLRSIKLLFDR